MPILLPDTSGIAQGISSAGGALGEVLQKVADYRTQEKQRQSLANMFGSDTTLGKVLSTPGGMQIAQNLAPILGPLMKSEANLQYSQNVKDRYTPIKAGATNNQPQQDQMMPQQQEDQQAGLMPQQNEPQGNGQQANEPQKTPIQQIQQYAKQGATNALENQDAVIQTPAGIFRKEDFISTPFGIFHPKQIQEMNASPNSADQREAQMINQYLVDQEKVAGKEGAEERKEWRNEIREYAKPYSDIEKLQSDLKQLNLAKNLINSSKNLNLDDNWVRSSMTAILEDKGWNQVKNLVRTNDQRQLYGYMYDFLKSKELGGANPSTKEVLLSMQAKPSEFLGKAANQKLINLMVDKAEIQLAKANAINKVRTKAGVISPSRFKMEVNNEMQPILKKQEEKALGEDRLISARRSMEGKTPAPGNVFMILPNSDSVAQIPKKDIKRAQNSGGRLLYDIR